MAEREEYTPIFEETEEVVRDRMLDRVDPRYRKEQGDYIYDAVAPSPGEIVLLQANQDFILKNSFPQYAEGDYMDLLLEEEGLTRNPATPNQRTLSVTADAGVVIPAGHILNVVILDPDGNPLEYSVNSLKEFVTTGTLDVALTCTTLGEIGNIPDGSEFILQPTIPGVQSIVDQGTTELGAEEETDAEAWDRLSFKVRNEDTGGNKNDYVRWAQDRTNVGKAKCIPRMNGRGTVGVIIVGTDYEPATQTVVDDLQLYLDPNSDGLGEGKAPCGAAVYVEAAIGLNVGISATVVLDNNYTLQQVTDSFTASVESYIESLVFYQNESTKENYPVAYNQIGALLITTDGVMNYSDLTLNGGTIDVPVGTKEAPVLGTVSLT
jgi:uncharacterized phage protein gp47/JayE